MKTPRSKTGKETSEDSASTASTELAPQTMPGLPALDAAVSSMASLSSLARVVRLEAGLYALVLGPSVTAAPPGGDIPLPTTSIASGPVDGRAPVEIAFTSGEFPGWLGTEGGTAIAKVPAGGGTVVVTSYGITDEAALPQLQLVQLKGAAAAATIIATVPAAQPLARGREIRIEMTAHFERQGDRQMLVNGWVGTPGQRRRIEAFGIRPLEEIRPAEIEYMALGPGSRQTPWVSDARLCGTRGRGLPLTGFAVRVAPALRQGFDVVYEGSFFASGIIGPRRNGEPCAAPLADDPLEAIRLRVIKRSAE